MEKNCFQRVVNEKLPCAEIQRQTADIRTRSLTAAWQAAGWGDRKAAS